MRPERSRTAGRLICTERTPRIVAARKLLRRAGRDRAGRFLAEGAQNVREALDWASRGGRVDELFATAAAAVRHPELVATAQATGIPVTTITDQAAATLSDTVTPQGLIAVCGRLDVGLRAALDGAPRLVAVLVAAADPGNAGAVIRTADAAGADAVLLAGDTVEMHNGKCVRASAGSVFHLPLAAERDVEVVLAACRSAGLTLVAADAAGELDLHGARAAELLAGPVGWLFGSEAHGLPPEIAAAADHRIRVPIRGRAESLNMASAAAVCLYATAREQPPSTIAGPSTIRQTSAS